MRIFFPSAGDDTTRLAPRTRFGFTLVETVVTLAVSGIVFAIAAPKMAAMRNASAVRSAMTDLGATFSMARQTAVARRTPVAVVIDTALGTIRVRTAGVALVTHALRTVYGVRVGSDRDSVVYDPRGLGYGLSNLSVTVQRGSFIDTLTVSRLGRVRW